MDDPSQKPPESEPPAEGESQPEDQAKWSYPVEEPEEVEESHGPPPARPAPARDQGPDPAGTDTSGGGGFDVVDTFQKMSLGEKIFTIASAATFICTLLPWATIDAGVLGRVFVGANLTWGVLVLLCSLGGVAIPWLPAFLRGEHVRRNLAVAALGVAGASVLFTLVGLIVVGQNFSVGVGVILALIGSGVMGYGAFLIGKDQKLF